MLNTEQTHRLAIFFTSIGIVGAMLLGIGDTGAMEICELTQSHETCVHELQR